MRHFNLRQGKILVIKCLEELVLVLIVFCFWCEFNFRRLVKTIKLPINVTLTLTQHLIFYTFYFLFYTWPKHQIDFFWDRIIKPFRPRFSETLVFIKHKRTSNMYLKTRFNFEKYPKPKIFFSMILAKETIV